MRTYKPIYGISLQEPWFLTATFYYTFIHDFVKTILAGQLKQYWRQKTISSSELEHNHNFHY